MGKEAKLLAITSLALFFFAGALAGILIDRKILAAPQSQVVQSQLPPVQPIPPKGKYKEDFIYKLKNDLALTPEQADKITNLLDQNENDFDKIREGIRDQFTSLDYKLFNKISGVLDENQKKKLLSSWMPSPRPDRPPPGAGMPLGAGNANGFPPPPLFGGPNVQLPGGRQPQGQFPPRGTQPQGGNQMPNRAVPPPRNQQGPPPGQLR
jgi:hypothetical protein